MLLKDALEVLQEKQEGYVVKNNNWTESTIQYGISDDGVLFWTAGGTVGGKLDTHPNHFIDKHKLTDWEYTTRYKGRCQH